MGVLILGGLAMSIFWGFWYGFIFILAGLVLLTGYILLGTVQSAAMLLQQEQDMEKADKRLNLTFKPDWLYSINRAFYYMLKGTIAGNRKQFDESEQWLLKAQAINMPSNEKAMVELQLASISASKGKWKQAEVNMRNIKQLNVTEPMLKQQIAEFEKAFAQRGQTQAANRMGMVPGSVVRPGGKRRRPKMR
jgi:tetratricopeptide (TPR) repeat protein